VLNSMGWRRCERCCFYKSRNIKSDNNC